MPVIRVLAGVVLVAVLTGCGDEEASTAVASSSTPPLFVNDASGSDAGAAAEIEGVLSVRSGCLWVGRYPAIWPRGTAWDGPSRTLRLPGGDEVRSGPRSQEVART